MRKFLVLLAIFAAVVSVGVGAAAATDSVTGYVVHGIPGLPVDVYVNGDLFAANFQPGTIAGPIKGPADFESDVVIVPVGGDPASPALQATLSFPAGSNVTLVAHLDANGNPTASLFNNDVSYTDQVRLTVRHVAAAPAVDALFFPGTADELRVGPLANGEETTAELPPATYEGVLVPTGTSTAVFGPISMPLYGGKLYVAYAIGSLSDGTFQILKQEIDL